MSALKRDVYLNSLIFSELQWEQIVQNFSNHVDSVRCLEITQKGFAINKRRQDEEKDIPSNPRQLSKWKNNR